MRKPIVLLDLILLLVVVGIAAGMRATWQRNQARYAAPAAASPAVTATGLGAGTQAPPALLDSSELVNRNLFSADRNNDQPVIKVEKKPRPPVPYVIGTLNLGSGMVALMVDRQQGSQGRFRRVQVGGQVGGYQVVEIADHKVVIEFDGERTTIDVYESAASLPGAASAAYVPPAASPVPQVQTAVSLGGTTATSTEAATPAAEPAGVAGAPPAAPGMLTVRIEGNYRIYTRATPFGVQTWKEEITPGKK